MKRAAFIRSYITFFIANESKVELSHKQVEGLRKILNMCDNTCAKLNGQIETAEKALDDLLSNINDKTDKKVIIEKTKALYALRAKLELAHFQLLGKAEALLAEDQKEVLKTLSPPRIE